LLEELLQAVFFLDNIFDIINCDSFFGHVWGSWGCRRRGGRAPGGPHARRAGVRNRGYAAGPPGRGPPGPGRTAHAFPGAPVGVSALISEGAAGSSPRPAARSV